MLANTIASTAGVLLAQGGRTAWAAVGLLVVARLTLPIVHPGHPGVIAPDAGTTFEAAAQHIPTVGPVDEQAPYAGRSVLLVTVDALRADRVPPWGDALVDTPAFDRLAAESITFERVHANSIWTTPSMVSFFTGLLPAVHGVHERGHELAPGIATPLEALAAAGWSTVGYTGDQTDTYRHLGFQRELDRDADPASEVEAHLGAAGPSFVWMHLRQIHAPYDATAERLRGLGIDVELPAAPILDRARTHYLVERERFPGRHGWLKEPIEALYAAELEDADRALGAILDRLDETGLAGRVIVVVSADHGEELLDHDGIGHASTTLDSVPQPELVRIPLYVRFPDGRAAGRQVAGVFEQVDLLPTLLPLLGVTESVDAARDGRDWSDSLLFESGAPPPPGPTLVSSTPCGWQCPPERRSERVHALIDGPRWSWCRESDGPCDGPLGAAVQAADQRRRALRTPVRSP